MSTPAPEATVTRATCPYCGTGCGVLIESRQGRIIQVKGDPQHPANFGRLCTKGSTLHLTAADHVSRQARLLTPMARATRGAEPTPLSWDTALEQAADRFARIIREHGPQAVGFYGSGQLLTEDYYVLNKLVKGLIGTNNLDTNSRLCMSSAVAGYKATLGADAPPACYDDFQHAQTLFIVGANTAWAHPILFRRIEDARKANPAMKLIVADPRRTETADMADLFLPIRPGTDVALFHGMLNVLISEGLTDPDYIARHTQGFEALATLVQDWTPQQAAATCGIPLDDLVQAARWMGSHTPSLSLYCQGLNQSSRGTDKNAALINLHLATGQIGKPGAGPFSLTGQPNAMGGREVGGMANLLSAHRDLANPAHREEVAALWGVDEVPAQPGLTAVEMFEAAARGEIKALWIACTNPAQSLPDQATVRRALARAEFVVVQEAFVTTATCAHADLLLPATTWGEKDGTVTNSERRISRVRPAAGPSGEARHDWFIFTDFGRRLEARLPDRTARYRAGTRTLFPYTSPESVWNEHRESTRGRDLDITGLSYALLDSAGPQQWPMPQGAAQGTARLYTDGVFPTANGRARFAAMPYEPVAEAQDAAYPFSLNTGRLRDQWHGMSRTGTLAQLYNHVEEPVVSMHAHDMQRRQISHGDIVKLSNKRGTLTIKVQRSDEVKPAELFIPMHWGSQFMHGLGVNALMPPAFDKTSKQPELKHTAVKIEKLSLPWQMTVMRNCNDLRLLADIRALLPAFDYATVGLYGRGSGMLILRAAHGTAPDPKLIAQLDHLLGMVEDAPMLRLDDVKRGISKRILVEQGQVSAVRLIGETLAADWLKQVMLEGQFTDELCKWALAPLAAPPTGQKSRGKIVCNCLDVSENEIIETCQQGADLLTLQAKLKCGTSCGSCVPELKRLVKLHGKTHAE